MSKVLVDRELLEQTVKHLEWDGDGSQTVMQYAQQGDRLAEELAEAIAQPAEAEGVSNARRMNTLAELARRAPLRTLHTICETQHQVSTVKLERYLEPIGDTLAGYAFTLRIDFDKLSAALSAVTAERDRLQQFEAAYNEWHDKTEWVQKTAEAHELGKHRADVLKDRVDKIQAEAEALRKDAERYRWLRDQAPKARGEWEIDGQRYGMMLGADQDDVDEAVDALMSAMAAKEE